MHNRRKKVNVFKDYLFDEFSINKFKSSDRLLLFGTTFSYDGYFIESSRQYIDGRYEGEKEFPSIPLFKLSADAGFGLVNAAVKNTYDLWPHHVLLCNPDNIVNFCFAFRVYVSMWLS